MSHARLALSWLFSGWVVNFAVRIFVFPQGGAGAWACTVAFVLLTLALAAVAVWKIAQPDGEGRLRSYLVLAGLGAFIYRGLVHNGPTAGVSAVIAICSIGALAALVAVDLVQEARARFWAAP